MFLLSRTLFRPLIAATTVFLGTLGSVSQASALTCAEYDAAYEKETENPDFEFFASTSKKQISKVYSELLIRKSAAAFWKTNTAVMDFKKLMNDAEDPYTDVVETPDGRIFALANIGFGGGNSISYLYKFETFELLPIAIYDGDCIEQGKSDALPIEAAPLLNAKATLACTIQDAKSPVSSFSISIDTEDGAYTGTPVYVSAELNSNFENLDRLTGGKNKIDQVVQPTAVMLSSSSNGAGANVGFEFDRQTSGDRIVEIRLSAREKKDASVWGKVYTNEVGGYWGANAYEYEYPAVCTFTGKLDKKVFKRVIEFQ